MKMILRIIGVTGFVSVSEIAFSFCALCPAIVTARGRRRSVRVHMLLEVLIQ